VSPIRFFTFPVEIRNISDCKKLTNFEIDGGGTIPIDQVIAFRDKKIFEREDADLKCNVSSSSYVWITFLNQVSTCLHPLKLNSLGQNLIVAAGARSLARLEFKETKKKVKTEGAKFLALVLSVKRGSIRTLDFSNSDISDNKVKSLSEGLVANTSLTKLNLGGNRRIGDTGVEALSQMLKTNRSIKFLNLSDNLIGHLGAQYLADALKINTKLKILDLGRNKIGDIGTQHLSEVLELNETLRTLNLNYNSISSKGASYLKEALKANRKGLRKLWLEGNTIDEGIVRAIGIMVQTFV